ncbi:MAG: sigma-70 family RNA polymerase sigma factor [Anaerocolumna sp.]
MIIDDIIKIQRGDNDSTLKLIEKFNPILKKYAYSLYYEDAYDDLLVDFIELLFNISIKKIQNKEDGCIISYLTTSIHNSYIKKLIKIKQMLNFTIYSDLTEKELYYIDSITATNDTYINTDFDLLRKILTNPEFIIIKKIFYDGYSVTETANAIGITRQAVNQMKNRALKKLKKIFVDKH